METPVMNNMTLASNTCNVSAYDGSAWTTFTDTHNNVLKIEGDNMAFTKKRLVRVFIADKDEEIALKDSLLYSGEEQFTDLTNQELFFEISIKPLLEKHNETRKKTIDKDRSDEYGRDIYLEPIKIRDLIMTVVEIAKF